MAPEKQRFGANYGKGDLLWKKRKGSVLLKVAGILMIIGGAISLILAIVAILGIALLASAGASSGLLYAAGAVLLISAVAELIAGIIGVKNWNKPEKAKTCICWGVIVAVLSVAGNVLWSIAGGDFSIPSLLLGLVLPVLYIIGAVTNKK